MTIENEILKAAAAFKAGKKFFGKIAGTDGKSVWVNSTKVAWKEPDGSIGAMIGGFA